MYAWGLGSRQAGGIEMGKFFRENCSRAKWLCFIINHFDIELRMNYTRLDQLVTKLLTNGFYIQLNYDFHIKRCCEMDNILNVDD